MLSKLSLTKKGVNLTVANAVQKLRLYTSLGLGDEVMGLHLMLVYVPLTEWANCWLGLSPKGFFQHLFAIDFAHL